MSQGAARRVRGAVVTALLLVAAAPALLASPPDPPSEPGLLRIAESPPYLPGQVVHLAWDPLPPEAEEFEILLTAELPRPLRLRLTESKESSCRHVAVVLPDLPSCTGRFLLRAGSPRGEFLFAESQPWLLRSPLAAPVAPVVERAGELWAEKASSSRGLRLDFRRPSAEAGSCSGSAAVLPEGILPPPRGLARVPVSLPTHTCALRRTFPAARLSLAYPLRI